MLLVYPALASIRIGIGYAIILVGKIYILLTSADVGLSLDDIYIPPPAIKLLLVITEFVVVPPSEIDQ